MPFWEGPQPKADSHSDIKAQSSGLELGHPCGTRVAEFPVGSGGSETHLKPRPSAFPSALPGFVHTLSDFSGDHLLNKSDLSDGLSRKPNLRLTVTISTHQGISKHEDQLF